MAKGFMRIDPFKHTLFRYQLNPEILKKLEELGLNSTGSVEGDLKAIKEAVGKLSKNSLNSAAPPKPETPPEIAVFMAKLGIKPTNSKEGDHAAIIEKLGNMLASAKTAEEKNEVNDLLNEFNIIIASLDPNDNREMHLAGHFRGMQQLGVLNSLFINKELRF